MVSNNPAVVSAGTLTQTATNPPTFTASLHAQSPGTTSVQFSLTTNGGGNQVTANLPVTVSPPPPPPLVTSVTASVGTWA